MVLTLEQVVNFESDVDKVFGYFGVSAGLLFADLKPIFQSNHKQESLPKKCPFPEFDLGLRAGISGKPDQVASHQQTSEGKAYRLGCYLGFALRQHCPACTNQKHPPLDTLGKLMEFDQFRVKISDSLSDTYHELVQLLSYINASGHTYPLLEPTLDYLEQYHKEPDEASISQYTGVNLPAQPLFWVCEARHPQPEHYPQGIPFMPTYPRSDHQPVVVDGRRRYVLTKHGKSGGMGTVQLGLDLVTGREVALKRITPQQTHESDRLFMELFLNEVRFSSAARQSNPFVVTILDLAVMDGELIAVLEWWQGVTLGNIIDSEILNQQPLPLIPQPVDFNDPDLVDTYRPSVQEIAMNLGLQVDREAAEHRLHRDLKPDNIFIDPFFGVLLTDFGLATNVVTEFEEEIDLSVEGDVTPVGTEDYLAPEVIRGYGHTIASQIYAIAIMCMELVTGQVPNRSSSFEVEASDLAFFETVLRAQGMNDTAAASTREVVAKAVSTQPSERHKHGHHFSQALVQALNQTPANTSQPEPQYSHSPSAVPQMPETLTA